MSIRFIKIFLCFVLTGVFMMSCANLGLFKLYQSTNPVLSFEGQFPADWHTQEFGGPGFGFFGVIFMPSNQGVKIFRPNFVVTAKKSAAFALSSVTLEAVADDAAQRCLKLPAARILKRRIIKVSQGKAAFIEVQYQGRTRLYSREAQDILLRERIVIVPHGDMFYTIRYVNDNKKFSQFEPHFRHALKTFRFLDV